MDNFSQRSSMSSSVVHGIFSFTIGGSPTVSGRDKKSTILKLGSLLLCHLQMVWVIFFELAMTGLAFLSSILSTSPYGS